MNNYYYWFAVVIVAIIFGRLLLWNVFKDIKQAKPEERPRKIKIYSGILVACLLLYTGLRMFAADPLSELYMKMAGIEPQPAITDTTEDIFGQATGPVT